MDSSRRGRVGCAAFCGDLWQACAWAEKVQRGALGARPASSDRTAPRLERAEGKRRKSPHLLTPNLVSSPASPPDQHFTAAAARPGQPWLEHAHACGPQARFLSQTEAAAVLLAIGAPFPFPLVSLPFLSLALSPAPFGPCRTGGATRRPAGFRRPRACLVFLRPPRCAHT